MRLESGCSAKMGKSLPSPTAKVTPLPRTCEEMQSVLEQLGYGEVEVHRVEEDRALFVRDGEAWTALFRLDDDSIKIKAITGWPVD